MPAPHPPRRICLIGAECTGKSTLARALAEHFSCPWVPEYLRQFCEDHARTPTAPEQLGIVQTQLQLEKEASAQALLAGQPYVFCDTAPLLTAIYSEYVFGDTHLLPHARQLHANYALTLLLDSDIPWRPDGLQRDGAHVRGPIQAMIARELAIAAIPWRGVQGSGASRLSHAMEEVVSAFGNEKCL